MIDRIVELPDALTDRYNAAARGARPAAHIHRIKAGKDAPVTVPHHEDVHSLGADVVRRAVRNRGIRLAVHVEPVELGVTGTSDVEDVAALRNYFPIGHAACAAPISIATPPPPHTADTLSHEHPGITRQIDRGSTERKYKLAGLV